MHAKYAGESCVAMARRCVPKCGWVGGEECIEAFRSLQFRVPGESEIKYLAFAKPGPRRHIARGTKGPRGGVDRVNTRDLLYGYTERSIEMSEGASERYLIFF